MNSVKDVRVDREPTDEETGKGDFVFSDRYSVFDWGEMPDHLEGKGKSLCVMGAFHFEKLENEGIPTHYRGVRESGSVDELSVMEDPPDTMAISLTRVPELPHDSDGYDYGEYFDNGGENYLIPLEVIFRNHVPPGSSLRSRRSPEEVGVPGGEWPEGTVELPEPLVEFSTKYEKQDRYLAEWEANRLAGEASLDELKQLAGEVNGVITHRAEKAGFRHEDGKIECLYCRGDVRVADVVGTFDENRFSIDGQSLSKEFLREYYRKNQPGWYREILDAKETARSRESADWKSLCDASPDPLPDRLKKLASQLYRAGANVYTGREWFERVPDLDSVVDRLEGRS